MAFEVIEEGAWELDQIVRTSGDIMWICADGLIKAHNSKGMMFGESFVAEVVRAYFEGTPS